MTDTDPLERINALTRNARNTWFGLLGVLVFVGITLMSVEHIDFYGVGRATQLPLVNVEVPTRFFFAAAPLLVAAIYGYFHLYLIRLWDALHAAPATIKEQPLGDAITPWLVTDAALHLRARHDPTCTTPRAMEGMAMLLNITLAWIFGIGILGWLWWESMAARELWLTGFAAFGLLACLYTGMISATRLYQRLRLNQPPRENGTVVMTLATLTLLIATPTLAMLSFGRTEGPTASLAPLEMIDEAIVERPPGWLPYAVARDEYRDAWCRRKGIDGCQFSDEDETAFTRDWQAKRSAQIADMRRPYWHKQDV